MKKFDELKALAEKNKHIRYYSEHPELQEDVTWFTAANPQTILALLADRERLKLALDIYVSTMKYIVNHDDVLHFAHRMRNTFEDAIKKSDEVDQ